MTTALNMLLQLFGPEVQRASNCFECSSLVPELDKKDGKERRIDCPLRPILAMRRIAGKLASDLK